MTKLISVFAAGLMIMALPGIVYAGQEDEKPQDAEESEATETAEAAEDAEATEIAPVEEMGGVRADLMGDSPDLTGTEMTEDAKARAESCRVARWHDGQGVPYDHFIGDGNQMLKQKVNPHVVVQTSSGGSRIKSRRRSVEKACEGAEEAQN